MFCCIFNNKTTYMHYECPFFSKIYFKKQIVHKNKKYIFSISFKFLYMMNFFEKHQTERK